MTTHEETTTRSSRSAALLAAAALTAGLGVTVPAHAAGPAQSEGSRVTAVDPAKLDRGPDPTIPHTDRGWFAAGDVRVKVGRYATYLGRSGSSWIVIGYRAKKNVYEVNRIARDGTVTVVLKGFDVWETVLSKDGSRIFTATVAPPHKRTVFRVFDATTGQRLTRRALPGYRQILAATKHRAYLSDDRRGTYTLNAKGRKRVDVTSERAALIDLRNDLMQTFTGDPYDKGCARVTSVSDPTSTVWRSCAERVEAFNPDGSGFATVDLLSDGIGPSLVQTREIDGTLTGRYTTTWFGTIGWESPDTLLTVANGPTESALVRCTAGACENAGNTYDAPEMRVAPRGTSPLLLRGGVG